MLDFIPAIEDVKAAAKHIEGKAIRTPLLRSDTLDSLVGATVFLKPECLQRTGSFKFRGAYNAISMLSEDQLANGVLAVSSGNHAQGVAEAARLLGASATIIMPSDAPKTKIERTQRSGAKIVLYDRLKEDREELARNQAAKTNASFIHPFNNPYVISGQGTVGLEIVADLVEQGLTPDHVLVCTGGGGLTAGTALAVRDRFPDCAIHTCEPAGFDDYRRSLESGKLETNALAGGSVCDAIVTPTPGEIGFAINRENVADGMAVSDGDALKAVAFAFRELKLVVEPGGAIALACLMVNRERFSGKTVCVTLSGGNMDVETLEQALKTDNWAS